MIVEREYELEIGPVATETVTRFSHRLRQIDPAGEMIPPTMFCDNSNNSNATTGRKLAQILRVARLALSRQTVASALHQLGSRATSRLRPDDYATVGATLLWAIETTVGESLAARISAHQQPDFWRFLGILCFSEN